MWSHKRSGDRREVHLHRNMNKRAHVYVEYETGGPVHLHSKSGQKVLLKCGLVKEVDIDERLGYTEI